MREIHLAGNPEPLALTWTKGTGANYANTWSTTIPVMSGDNAYTLEAYDYQGDLIGTSSINVISTSTNPVVDSLRITELNYNPGDPSAAELAVIPELDQDDFEFIELQNTGSQPINLIGTRFNAGIQYTFPSSVLTVGERGLLVKDTTAFELRYGTDHNIIGQYDSGTLNNGGETLTLVDSQNDTVLSFSYDDNDPWPQRADGDGGTLELVNVSEPPVDQLGKYYHWQGSIPWGGSPGQAGPEPLGVVISEVLANTDAEPESDSIELFNTTESPIEIGQWWLSDSAANLFKYQLPAGTVLGAGQRLVLDESDFNPSPLNPGPNDFRLSGSEGDDVWLVDHAGNGTGVLWFADDVHFGATASGESLGRWPHSTGRLSPLNSVTLGTANSDPRVGPLVISEVHYNPGTPSPAALAIDATLTGDDLEFVEVFNPTANSVSLQDWRIRGGVDIDFSSDTTLAASQTLVVVAFDPDNPANQSRREAFLAHYGIESGVTLVGGYQGQASNNGERLELQRAGTSPPENPLLIPRLLEDEVLYDNLAPWPTAAAGTGNSLQRNSAIAWGNDSSSWTAAVPSPGVFNGSLPGDFNADQVVDDADIDLLFAAVNTGSGDLLFDLDSSGTVTSSDVTFLVGTLLGTRLGDIDLDSDVDTGDLTAAIINFTGASGTGKRWSQGDNDGDGDVDTGDLTRAIINFTGAKSSVSTALRSPGPWTIGASSLKGSAQPNLPAISVVEADREEPTHAPAATNDSLRDLPRSLASSSPAAKRPTSQVDRLPQLDDRQ